VNNPTPHESVAQVITYSESYLILVINSHVFTALLFINYKLKKKFPENLKIELPYAPPMPLLDIYPKEVKSVCQKRHLNTLAYYSTIYNGQKTESTYVSSDG
jgi:hypothetical protein